MGSEGPTLLDVLRSHSSVDCDTLDAEVPAALGPFVDCTSNQAIAYHELIRVDGAGKPVHAALIQEARDYAAASRDKFPGVDPAEVAVEAMMAKLALRIVPHLRGYSHVQTNPKYSYDRAKTVANGQRIVAIFKDLDPAYDAKRVCIKIPSTWEGIQACRELEAQGIATLATTMFCMEQAALAGRAGCTYIAPYVNELRVHFDAGYVDENKAFAFCAAAQRYYARAGRRTQVLPASLTCIAEVMALAGVNHITVAPPLLRELAATPARGWSGGGETGSVFREGGVGKEGLLPDKEEDEGDYAGIVEDEAAWRLAFSRCQAGRMEAKNIQAINIFCEKQEGLERLART